MRSSLVAVALLVMPSSSWAADLLLPDSALSSAEVVSIQLNALQANETPNRRRDCADLGLRPPEQQACDRSTAALCADDQRTAVSDPAGQSLASHQRGLSHGRSGRFRGDRH
jgi:hypothetical protein